MMKQRFVIRLAAFVLLALLAGFVLGISSGLSMGDCIPVSGFILCLIYSGRLLWPCVTQTLSTLMKAGFIAILFGSLPGIVIVLVAAFFLSGVLAVACIVLGCVQLIRELVQSILADAAV